MPTVEKDELAKWFVRGFILTEKPFMFCERKIIRVFSGYKEWKSDYNPEPTGLKYIDHMVGNVGWNEMNTGLSSTKR
jgi:4-hydroxyphenylpyruvate dioxygenase